MRIAKKFIIDYRKINIPFIRFCLVIRILEDFARQKYEHLIPTFCHVFLVALHPTVRCFVSYIITLRVTLARMAQSFQRRNEINRERKSKGERREKERERERKREKRAQTKGTSRKFTDDFPESVIRRSASTRASYR